MALWRFFSSVRLTIVLLIVLAVASIAGTLVPQQGQEAVEFARKLGSDWFRVFSALDLFDVYHSPWFRILIGLLTVNLVVCSTDRFPAVWKRFTAEPSPDREKPFTGLPEDQEFVTQAGLVEASGLAADHLRERFRKVREKSRDSAHFFITEHGRYSHFGVYLIHLSVLVILMGGMVGSFLGFEAFLNIAEGDRVDTVRLVKNRTPLALGFEVQCDEFSVEFYENGAPKEYRSELVFFEDGERIQQSSVLVNHPARFRGVTFYQSSYGTIPGESVRLRLVRGSSENQTTTHETPVGSPVTLPGNEGRFQVLDVSGNLKGVMGPAALIEIQPNQGEGTRFWVFRHPEILKERFPPEMLKAPVLDPSGFEPYTFFLEELETRYYTGLQVNKDPGVPLVWAGCFLMVAGLVVTFFTSHRRIRVRLIECGKGARVSVSGTSNKNPVGLERELIQLTEKIRETIEERKNSHA